LSDAALILQEINRQGCNSGACHAQMYIMGTILRHGSEEQKQRYLPAIAAGDLRLQAFGVTEPDAGSNTLALRTRADRRPDGSWLVNGQKIWTSRFAHSDLMLLLARTSTPGPGEARTGGLSTFLVDLRKAGDAIDARPIRTLMNHATVELFIKDLALPEEALVGEQGKGFSYILDGMNAERILIAAECVGDGHWFIERASAYARERVVFDRPIGRNQGVQFPLARAHANVCAAELMCWKAAELFEAGESCGPEANMAKLLASEASWEAANACLSTHGGFGFAEEYDIERKFRENRLYMSAPIHNNLILAYLGQHVLGMPKSY
jgi:alkylation response protein AidB-like acyl-CoA dehydrogenase